MVTFSRKGSQAPPFIVSCVVSCMLKASILPAECLSYGVSSDQISVFRASILPAASFSPLADISSTASRPIKQVSIVRPFVCSRAFSQLYRRARGVSRSPWWRFLRCVACFLGRLIKLDSLHAPGKHLVRRWMTSPISIPCITWQRLTCGV